jgi:uncharacterized membrane protein
MNAATLVTWLALGGGALAAASAFYGHYRELPVWMTGPEICSLEGGGCAVLFRSPRSALLGVPNAGLGLLLYALLAVGLILQWPPVLLWVTTLPAVAMSAFLGYSLIVNRHQCRICWTGHTSNALLCLLLGLRAFTSSV